MSDVVSTVLLIMKADLDFYCSSWEIIWSSYYNSAITFCIWRL